MAELGRQATYTGIAGLDANGEENGNFAEIDGRGKVLTKDVIKNHGHTQLVSVGTSPVEAKTTNSPSERVSLTIENQGTIDIKWSFVNSNTVGHLIPVGGSVHMAIGNQKVYVFTASGTNANIVVSEGG